MTSPRKALAGLCLVLLAGCKSAGIETSQQAANVYLSTYPAVPWKEVADKLEPRLDLAPEVSKAFTVEGYAAHLVTLQVALQPKARNLPYDVYLNISMYPATTWQEAVASPRAKLGRGGPPPIMVYPLAISEAGEGMGVDALATVGRVSDNSLRIRFGAHEYAMEKGVARYGILPRTHNVSMVVITRASTSEKERIANLLVISETEIVPVLGGKPLPNAIDGRRPEEDLAEAVTKLVGTHGFSLRPQCSADAATKRRNDWALDLLRAVDRQDYPGIQQCLTYRMRAKPRNSPLPDDMEAEARTRLERLVGDLIKIQAGARYAKMVLPLPELAVAKPAAPAPAPAPAAPAPAVPPPAVQPPPVPPGSPS
jgi:hypothetical protein